MVYIIVIFIVLVMITIMDFVVLTAFFQTKFGIIGLLFRERTSQMPQRPCVCRYVGAEHQSLWNCEHAEPHL